MHFLKIGFAPWAKVLIVVNTLLVVFNSSINFAIYCGDAVFRECVSAMGRSCRINNGDRSNNNGDIAGGGRNIEVNNGCRTGKSSPKNDKSVVDLTIVDNVDTEKVPLSAAKAKEEEEEEEGHQDEKVLLLEGENQQEEDSHGLEETRV